MELPTDVLIHSQLLGMKGKEGTLLQIHGSGFYEIVAQFGERLHRMWLPVTGTALIARDEEDLPEGVLGGEIER